MNDFSSFPGTYLPLPPSALYDHPDEPHAVVLYASNLGHLLHPKYFPMPYGPPTLPPEQYPHFFHSLGPQYGAGSLYGEDSPGTSGPVRGEEAPPLFIFSSSAPNNTTAGEGQPLEGDERV